MGAKQEDGFSNEVSALVGEGVAYDSHIKTKFGRNSTKVRLLKRRATMASRNSITSDAVDQEEYIRRLELNLRDKLKREILIMFDYKFVKQLIRELHMFYPGYEDRTFELEPLFRDILKEGQLTSHGQRVSVLILYEEDEIFTGCSLNRKLSEMGVMVSAPPHDIVSGEYSITPIHAKKYYETFERLLLNKVESAFGCKSIFIVSDRNDLPDEIFEKLHRMYYLVLGRLDDDRTTCFPSTYDFDVQELFRRQMHIRGNDLCRKEYIFSPDDGRWVN